MKTQKNKKEMHLKVNNFQHKILCVGHKGTLLVVMLQTIKTNHKKMFTFIWLVLKESGKGKSYRRKDICCPTQVFAEK